MADSDRSVVENSPAFLATTTTRMCINFAQSARSRRETYLGPWLPEPVDTSSDPVLGAERSEALGLAILLLLEKLTPTCRVRSARGVRLPLPTDRGRPANVRGEHSPARFPRP